MVASHIRVDVSEHFEQNLDYLAGSVNYPGPSLDISDILSLC